MIARRLVEEDRAQAEALARDYLPDSHESLLRSLEDGEGVVVVAAGGGRVVGVCYGRAAAPGGGIRLDGIAVEASSAGRGTGSELLKAFEKEALATGSRRVSLGSAEGYVEPFYEKNGYTAIEYLVTTRAPVDLTGARDLEVVRARSEGGSTRLNIRSARGYTQREKERVRALASADEVMFIYEKWLSRPRLGDGVVVLDQHTLDDVEAHVAGEDEEQARRFGWYPKRSTEATVRAAIERWQAEWASGGATRAFALREAASGSLAGGCEVRVGTDGVAEMSYWVFPAHRRRGFATRAARLVCDWAFAELGVERMEIHVETDNDASRRVAESAGFTEESVRARAPFGEERRDMVLYARLGPMSAG